MAMADLHPQGHIEVSMRVRNLTITITIITAEAGAEGD